LVAADPHVTPDRFPSGVTPVDATAEELAAADAVVVLVDHLAFDPTLVVAHARYVLDTKAHLPAAANVERL
ncbi:MAG: nucleotide sugar dehydrogenase, partial [Acidimicrobiales bacterium]